MDLSNIFCCTAILDGAPVLGRDEVVSRLLTLLAEAGHVPLSAVPAIRAAVLRRELMGSTGLGKGLAIPHAKHAAVQQPLGVLAVCRLPIWFDALDGEPVDIFALLLTPPDRPGQHLGEASRWSEGLVRTLADEEFCRRLRRARSAEEVEEVVQAAGGMTRREWMACTDPTAMLRLLRDRSAIDERKARLFGSACCRRHWELLPDEGRRAIEVVERHADGLAGRDELDAARRAFTATIGEASGPASFASVAVSYLMAEARRDPAGHALDLSAWAARVGGDQTEELAGIVRCLFGPPPFRMAVRLEWLAWNDGVAVKLARAVYEERAFDLLPILADALEDAGCDNADILGHCRGPGPHARGCFVLDRLTGRG